MHRPGCALPLPCTQADARVLTMAALTGVTLSERLEAQRVSEREGRLGCARGRARGKAVTNRAFDLGIYTLPSDEIGYSKSACSQQDSRVGAQVRGVRARSLKDGAKGCSLKRLRESGEFYR